MAMFWTKIGTNTGIAESGTVEEIDLFVGAAKPAVRMRLLISLVLWLRQRSRLELLDQHDA